MVRLQCWPSNFDHLGTNVSTEVQDEKQQLKLDVDISETSACGRHITVTISRAEVERYFTEQFDDLVPKAEILSLIHI